MSKPVLIGALVDYGKAFPYPYTDEQSDRFRRQNEMDRKQAETEDLEHLRSMANKALSGVYGASSKAVALAWCRDIYGQPETVAGIATRPDLEALRSMLRRVPDRVSG
jgi:hypothetical protein